eukprot:CAMPEP_0176020016 /NCGR_PEP_ID=MMETSP0120_2-20121206/9685_1 /TAXON_ID=160619 /ORGANISM="Kryptoperidinium foliaceum, Strain CCMP 1326" /LENGTH=1787 /DNA_ID=CAMNT_0017353103 /DNA_START=63 /DNA_END=5426 /DNA_ORIENTATION=-
MCFLILCFMLKRETSAEMYEAVVQRFMDAPFRQDPRATFYDVTNGMEVYEWISKVFLPEVYAEQPSPLDDGAYCTVRSKCLLNEGDVQSDRQCAGSLRAGSNNCPSFMGSETDCCEPCSGPTCGSFDVGTRVGDLSNTTAVEDVSENCADPVKGWLQDLSVWNRARRLQEAPSAVAKDFMYCPEWLSKVKSDVETRTGEVGTPVMMAGFNRVLMGRMTLKRVKLVSSNSKAFANAYPQMWATTRTDAYSYNPNYENTKPFGPALAYTYQEDEGFYNAGGFVQYIDFEQTKDQVFDALSTLKRHHWFDLNQGSFVLELLMYNGNVDNFLYVAFIFEHDFAGRTKVSVEACPLDLGLHDMSNGANWARFVVYLFVVIFFIYFLKAEVEDMLVSYIAYFSDPLAILQLVSLLLTLVCLVLYISVAMSYTFLNFEFPLDEDPAERQQEFKDLANLALGFEQFSGVLAVNTFLVCVRAVPAVAVLVPQFGIVLDSLRKVKYTLAAWMSLYFSLLIGFSFAALYIFGPRAEEFCTLTASVITSVKVMMGGSIKLTLEKSDPGMAFFCFIVFTVPFFIVHEVFYAIVLSGYSKDRQEKDKSSDLNNSPLVRLLLIAKTWVVEHSQSFNQCLAPFQILFGGRRGGGGIARVNKDFVAVARDRRSTKLRLRELTYDKKTGENDNDGIDKDIKWRVTKPVFAGGFAQFYVHEVTGRASEAHVEKGFRLIEIRAQGERDREEFRKQEDMQQYLKKKSLPVTLILEGRPKPPLWEPIGFAIFLALFLQFFFIISRVPDSYGLTMVFEDSFLAPQWSTYNPKQEVSYASMDRMGHIPNWVSAGIIGGGYGCVSGLNAPNLRCQPEANGVPRGGWYLWRGAGVEGEATSAEGGVQKIAPLETVPAAADGMSLGYVPLVPPARFVGSESICATQNDKQEGNCPECVMGPTCKCLGSVKFGYDQNWTRWTPVNGEIQCTPEAFGLLEPPPNAGNICVCRVQNRSISEVIRMQEYNVGIMPNNHVRLTFQTPCFKKNPDDRYAPSYPYILDPSQAFWEGCANTDCMNIAKEANLQCLNAQGEVQSLDKLTGGFTGIGYQFSKTGTYRDLGGIAVGFGRTKEEADMVSKLISQDGILARESISSAFEIVTYNAIYDMFMYSSVTFGLKPTGKLQKSLRNIAFPLNTFSSGAMENASSLRVWAWFCFAFYIIAAVFMFVIFIREFRTQSLITKALLRPGWFTIPDFFTDDWWNIVDFVIVLMDISVIATLCDIMLLDSSFTVLRGVESWTSEFAFTTNADMMATDQVRQFQRAADIFADFSGVAAIRGVLLVVRLMRYFAVTSALRTVLSAVSFAKAELLIVCFIHALMLVGFVVMVAFRFGVAMSTFSTMTGSFCNLFLFLVGRFPFTVQDGNGALFWFFVMPTFQACALLFTGMMLGVIATRWKDARRDAQESSINLTGVMNYCYWCYRRLSGKSAADEDKKAEFVMLDKTFWEQQSMLQLMTTLDESGKVTPVGDNQKEDGKSKNDKSKNRSHHHEGSSSSAKRSQDEDEDEAGGIRTFKFDSADDKAMFQRTFRKAHMNLASQNSKKLKDPGKEDKGAGVGNIDAPAKVVSKASMPSKKKNGTGRKTVGDAAGILRERVLASEDVDAQGFAGIIEDKVPQQRAKEVKEALEAQLTDFDVYRTEPLKEVWLDALVTVLEEVGALDRLQKLYMPPRCQKPRKQTEWSAFNERKAKMEKRLDDFFELLKEEAEYGHSMFMKHMAEDKERGLKQQSLVLTDYLETLEKQIAKTNQELDKRANPARD